MRRVAVLGGGASGMTAAIFAARAGAEVTLFEHNERVGKKLLQTGNGKCNYSNRNLGSACFMGSASRDFLEGVFRRFSVEDTLLFFEELGVKPRFREERIYPYPETASAVLDVLRFELARLSVRVCTGREARKIFPAGDGKWKVTVVPAAGAFSGPFDAVILSCGGNAAPKTGSDGSGCRMAKELGLLVTDPLPALTQLLSGEPWFKGIAGVRCDAALSLLSEGEKIGASKGELQLTGKGLSGICAFDLSGRAARELSAKRHCEIRVSFLPDMDEAEAEALISRRFLAHPERTAGNNLTGLFHKQLSALFLKRLGISPEAPSKELPPDFSGKLSGLVTAFDVPLCGVGGFEHAQVTSGGVDMSQIRENLEAAALPGVFLTGELLDVDGICGGYNLQWAWSTGAIAGRAAAGENT